MEVPSIAVKNKDHVLTDIFVWLDFSTLVTNVIKIQLQ